MFFQPRNHHHQTPQTTSFIDEIKWKGDPSKLHELDSHHLENLFSEACKADREDVVMEMLSHLPITPYLATAHTCFSEKLLKRVIQLAPTEWDRGIGDVMEDLLDCKGPRTKSIEKAAELLVKYGAPLCNLTDATQDYEWCARIIRKLKRPLTRYDAGNWNEKDIAELVKCGVDEKMLRNIVVVVKPNKEEKDNKE